jgi:CHAD domain-containing protein
MTYRLKPTEPLPKGLVRIARRQIERCLPPPKSAGERATWVHETRKSLKRTRSLLRLFRSGLGSKAWRIENAALRDIARALGAMREQDVLPATLTTLVERRNQKTAKAARTLLAALPSNGFESSGEHARVMGEVELQLAEAHERLLRLRLHGDPLDVLEAGLAATHRAGRKRLAEAAAEATDEAMHELRKAVQIHWRQMQLLEQAWPGMVAARIDAARSLAQELGEHQDFAMLAEFAASGAGKVAAGRIVAGACRTEQARLRRQIFPSARRLFAAEPEAFAAEVLRLWRTSVETATVEPAADGGYLRSKSAQYAGEGGAVGKPGSKLRRRLKQGEQPISGALEPGSAATVDEPAAQRAPRVRTPVAS